MVSVVVSSYVAVYHVAVSHVAIFLAVDGDTVRVGVGLQLVGVGLKVRVGLTQ